jgi:hypothetical protein
MTRIGLSSIFGLLAAASVASAQGSPPAAATVTIAGKAISVRYSAPSVRGRKIFGAGGLLSKDPTYPAWRGGANAATALHTDAALNIGGLAVPKGNYTLYVWVKDPDAWELIVNKETGQSGLDYSASKDLGRVKMTMAKPPALVETLKYTLADKGGGKAELRLEWENRVATVPITVAPR